MKEVFFPRIPQVGQVYALKELNLNGDDEPLGDAVISKVEDKIESEWNPVFKKREAVPVVYVTFNWNGGLYQRKALIGGDVVFNTPQTWLRGRASSPTPDDPPSDERSDS
jgi:hypothetical protein